MFFSQHSKLGINTSCPLWDLVVNDVNSFKSILEFWVIVLDVTQIIVHLDDFCVLIISSSTNTFTRINLQVVESFAQLFIVSLKNINSTLVIRNCCQKLSVCLFTLFKSEYHGLNICHSSGSLDLLESIINLLRCSHFFFHFLTHKVVPEFVDIEVMAHFKLWWILTLVGSCLSNFLVLSLPFNSATNRLLFVVNAFLELNNSVLSVTLLFLDILH